MEKAKNKYETWDWMKALFIAIALAFIIRTFLFSPIVVDGASMQPTLQSHDRMIVTKIGEPKRFDIVVFHSPTESKDYIKRVIGLPGDRIEFKDDTLYINDIPFDEPYLEELKQDVMGPLTGTFTLRETAVGSDVVPEGHLFVLGDNRPYSKDSREIGAIPIEQVVGTTNIVFYPFNEMKIIDK
ncbi:signal peptidase I [Bacillus alkalicellulosilyticus]|uniref:signal peptidase I n=1 Tax=Alkalihalobacterium alkalicellulosilyticum TaxID=1912214 RepID=UPI0024819D50|nr:signal peptidase I [Bacillus alkalicellulosilyticus]